MISQIRSLARNPKVIVATAGRLIDHLNQRTLDLGKVNIVVLDEADRMLDMGFEPHIRVIFSSIRKDRQTMLFSATMPDGIMKIATSYMHMPVRVEVAPPGVTVDRVTQEIFVVHKDSKNRLVDKLLDEYRGSALVFTRTKHGAKRLTQKIRTMGHKAAEIHSNRTLSQRREALDGFKSGRYRVLVATDIASRGIDVAGIALVINYDVPNVPEDYVHRIGRTARAGAAGHAITFVTPEQRGELRRIERLIRRPLSISKLPELPAERPNVAQFEPVNSMPRRPFRSGSRRRVNNNGNNNSNSNSKFSQRRRNRW